MKIEVTSIQKITATRDCGCRVTMEYKLGVPSDAPVYDFIACEKHSGKGRMAAEIRSMTEEMMSERLREEKVKLELSPKGPKPIGMSEVQARENPTDRAAIPPNAGRGKVSLGGVKHIHNASATDPVKPNRQSNPEVARELKKMGLPPMAVNVNQST